MKRLLPLSLPAILLICSCATTPTPQTDPPKETSRVFNAPYDKVWSAVVAELSADYPIKNSDKSSGLITTEDVTFGASFGGWSSLRQVAY